MSAKNHHFYILILLLIGLSSNIYSQRFELGINHIQGISSTTDWGFFGGGIEFTADYKHPHKDWFYIGGVRFRTIQWGSQTDLSVGVARKIGKRFEIAATAQNGLALFIERPLYVFSMGAQGSFFLINKQKFGLGLSLETRYSICPAYQKYSTIYSVFELPLGVFIRF